MLRSFVRTLVGEDEEDKPEMLADESRGSFVDVGPPRVTEGHGEHDSGSDSESDASKEVTQSKLPTPEPAPVCKRAKPGGARKITTETATDAVVGAAEPAPETEAVDAASAAEARVDDSAVAPAAENPDASSQEPTAADTDAAAAVMANDAPQAPEEADAVDGTDVTDVAAASVDDTAADTQAAPEPEPTAAVVEASIADPEPEPPAPESEPQPTSREPEPTAGATELPVAESVVAPTEQVEASASVGESAAVDAPVMTETVVDTPVKAEVVGDAHIATESTTDAPVNNKVVSVDAAPVAPIESAVDEVHDLDARQRRIKGRIGGNARRPAHRENGRAVTTSLSARLDVISTVSSTRDM